MSSKNRRRGGSHRSKGRRDRRRKNGRQGGTRNKGSKHPLVIVLKLWCFFPGCSEPCPSREGLTDHCSGAHAFPANKCLFPECNMAFENPGSLGRHQRDEHPGKNELRCPLLQKTGSRCFFVAYSHGKVHNHIETVHITGEFRCGYANCGKMGKKKASVHSHYIRKHERDKGKRHLWAKPLVPFNSNQHHQSEEASASSEGQD